MTNNNKNITSNNKNITNNNNNKNVIHNNKDNIFLNSLNNKKSFKGILRLVNLYVKAGEAQVTPPIGPLLSQHSIDVKQFCTMFNNETKDYEKGIILKVELFIYTDNTFTFKIKSSPLFFLFELSSKLLQIQNNYKNKKGISLIDIYLITLIKNNEYKLINIKKLFKIILKEAKKLGYKIIEKTCEDMY